MTFLNIFDSWYEWDKESMHMYSYGGSWCEVDENSSDFLNALTLEADSWHDLYLKTGFNPLRCDEYTADVWVDVNGDFFTGDSHEVQARSLCEIVYGVTDNNYGGDYLLKRGWIKLTTGFMLRAYKRSGMYDNINKHQSVAIIKWCDIHKIEYF